MNHSQLVALTERCVGLFGDPRAPRGPQTGTGYSAPLGYPGSLALCIIDSIQSTGVRYPSVEAVVARYRAYRNKQGGNADSDGTTDLLKTFQDLNGSADRANKIGNKHKTSTRTNAPLKAAAIHAAATGLEQLAIRTADGLREALAEPARAKEVEASWKGVVGQRSGITWHYVQMLAGVPGVKPDRMIIRFVADSVGLSSRTVPPADALWLVTDAAKDLGISPTVLDHTIWQWQRTARRTGRRRIR